MTVAFNEDGSVNDHGHGLAGHLVEPRHRRRGRKLSSPTPTSTPRSAISTRRRVSLKSMASSFGTSLSVVSIREDFAKAMSNTLATGADNLVLADTNEEAAALLALQARQDLAATSLSLASKADQTVLRLFGVI